LSQALLMVARKSEMPKGRAVGAQLVGRDLQDISPVDLA
jgi:hypothetical protein